MRKILVATHSYFAEGIRGALNFILGDKANLDIMNAYITQDFDIEAKVNQILEDLSEDDELIVLVDLLGGSVSNTFSNKIYDRRLHVISGVNFPMLLEIVLSQSEDIEEVIKSGIESGKNGIVYVNEVVNKTMNDIEEGL
ncbi:PTS fructose transporter subunit IIA [Clostridium tertium]|uniref:PTS sugar transporter subunit IIA n=1 Tax=Clostridium TaxID=1485 RepID=UPI00163DA864|nr:MULTISPECIES: PTS fructose transporter subunit IIA [Clostridium]MBS4958676.1 PTS fructose transporter subunit IIA [Clostridium sp.]MDB1921634.1 PTS fructose transporter subunit IIA [Clostridium tertium]MDB1924838.1 PTS fructose transporter subunit IIA [Clostridium tertium]MDB1930555.1 PTS fructose transporter subunit IIA [Clostridium tertium]MDU2157404.1 PTS fructose transporter subunit IIA [Clostridium sp.]